MHSKLLIILICSVLLLFLFASSVSAVDTCLKDDVKTKLKIALVDFFQHPLTPSIPVSQIRDLLDFYLNTIGGNPSGDCETVGTQSSLTMRAIITNIDVLNVPSPSCQGGVPYGECSASKPEYCFTGSIIEKCSVCGCPTGEACQSDDSCQSGVTACNIDADCGPNLFNGPFFCQSSDVNRNLTNYTCNNPGQPGAFCSSSNSTILIDDCNPLTEICINGNSTCDPNLVAQCEDGIDNDGDTFVDFPADPGCTALNDTSELGVNECDDGLDNDGDGFADLIDPGCYDFTDLDEHNATIECDDGIDNDGDNLTDYPADLGCINLTDTDETNCGDTVCEGGENSLSCSLDCPQTDFTPPNVDYILPTPTDLTTGPSSITINVSIADTEFNIDSCTLEFNGVNESMIMVGSGLTVTCTALKSGLTPGGYNYKVYANDTVGNMNSSATRTYSVTSQFTLFTEDFETGWVTSTINACSAGDCAQIGSFTNCDNNAADFRFCASSDTSPDTSNTGTYGLVVEDWDLGTTASSKGIWYNFDPSTACGGTYCDNLEFEIWVSEFNMAAGQFCWITEEDVSASGIPSAIITIDSVYGSTWTQEKVNLTIPMQSTNANLRIMCDMSATNNEVYFDDISLTGTRFSSCGDAVCNGGESCLSCASDCGVCTDFTIFQEGFEGGWVTSTSNGCVAFDDCSQIGNFNGCDTRGSTYDFCASSDTAPDVSNNGTYGLVTEQWETGAVTNTDGIWYTFEPSTACGGSFCDYITLDVWTYELGLDASEYCWVTEQLGSGIPSAILTIDTPFPSSFLQSTVNFTLPTSSSENWTARIMCKMSSTGDDNYWDDFKITGYKFSSCGDLTCDGAEDSFNCPGDCGLPGACEDSVDNDADNLSDFPTDPGCFAANDTSELGTNECDDGSDNDGDGFLDIFDVGCIAVNGTDESNCGDFVCEGAETCGSCGIDCGGCPDLSPPVIGYQFPTPNDAATGGDSITINVSAVDAQNNVDACILEWNGVNETMTKIGNGLSVICTATKGGLSETTYTYNVHANDSIGNMGPATERTYTVQFGIVGYPIFYDDFETGWDLQIAEASCSTTYDCNQIGSFNGCLASPGDLEFCHGTNIDKIVAHEGTYGLILEDWDSTGTGENLGVTSTKGIWYTFNPSIACGGTQCTYIELNVWINEAGMDLGENCWITEQDGAGIPSAILTIDSTSAGYFYYKTNFTLPLSSTNWSARIMCSMSSGLDDVYWDEFNITGYK